MSKPQLDRATFEFSQEANCVSKNDGCETLTIECESSLGIDNDGGCFYVLKTDAWSIDSVQDLQELFDRIQKTITQNKKDNE
jgi:DNA polymerase III gamma/tau subunit